MAAAAEDEVSCFLDAFAGELSESQWAGVAAKLKSGGGLSEGALFQDRACALPLVCDGCTRIIQLATPDGQGSCSGRAPASVGAASRS